MAARAHRSWLKLVEVVAESLPEDGRRGLSGKHNAAISLLELAGYVAADKLARAEHASMAVKAFSVSRVHARPKLRSRYELIPCCLLQLYVVCVCLCGGWRSYGKRPGAC